MAASLRILTVGSLPPSWGGATTGGVAAVHAQLTAEFLSPDLKWGVALSGVVAPNLAPGAAPKPPVLALPAGLSGPAQRRWYLETLSRLAPDLVLYHHLAHLWAREHARACPIPYVGIIHSWHPVTFGPPEAREKKRAILHEVLPRAAALVFPSRHALEEGRALAMPYPPAVHVVHNPVDPAFFAESMGEDASAAFPSPLRGGWTAALGGWTGGVPSTRTTSPLHPHDAPRVEAAVRTPPERPAAARPSDPLKGEGGAGAEAESTPPTRVPRIAAVGSLVPRKRLDLVIRACAALGSSLVVAGEGELDAELRALARSLGADVAFAGAVPPQELAALVAGCDALCVPSASESFGNVYAEALALGVPVIGFAPTLAEIAGAMGMKIGVGVPPDATLEDVTEALRTVLATDWNRHALATQAATRFSPRAVAASYAQIMRQAATAPPPPQGGRKDGQPP